MATEIERRFLVTDPSVLEGRRGTRLEQGYLPVEAPASVRVRLAEGDAERRAFLTIKQGTSARRRLEFEYPIPLADARELLAATCGAARIRKTRYRVPWAGRAWEVDRFEDENAPLLLAEVELEDEAAPVELPPWVGREVTDDARLTNVRLCRTPLARWPAAERRALLGDRREEP
jgi:CYTH domain-containing protein